MVRLRVEARGVIIFPPDVSRVVHPRELADVAAQPDVLIALVRVVAVMMLALARRFVALARVGGAPRGHTELAREMPTRFRLG